jgi:hypothetical protein
MGLRSANSAAGGELPICLIPYDGRRSVGTRRANAKNRVAMPGPAHPTSVMVEASHRVPGG